MKTIIYATPIFTRPSWQCCDGNISCFCETYHLPWANIIHKANSIAQAVSVLAGAV